MMDADMIDYIVLRMISFIYSASVHLELMT